MGLVIAVVFEGVADDREVLRGGAFTVQACNAHGTGSGRLTRGMSSTAPMMIEAPA